MNLFISSLFLHYGKGIQRIQLFWWRPEKRMGFYFGISVSAFIYLHGNRVRFWWISTTRNPQYSKKLFLLYFLSRFSNDCRYYLDVFLPKNRHRTLSCDARFTLFYAQLLLIYIPLFRRYQSFPFYRIWNAGDYSEVEVF